MKKYLFSFIFIFTGIFFLQAQNLEIYYEGELVDDTLYLSDFNAMMGEITFEANVKNNTDRDLNVSFSREELSIVNGSSNSYCWAGNCWPSELDTCPSTQIIEAGQTTANGDLSGHYYPNGFTGTSVIKYTFWDEEMPEYNTSVVVKYTYEVQSDDLQILYDGETVNSDTIVVTDYNANYGEMEFDVIIKNTTEKDMSVYAAKIELDTIPNTSNYFCWAGNCLPSFVDTSTSAQIIPAGGTSNEGDFAAHYSPMNNIGTTTIKYSFFEENKSKASAYVVVKFKYDPSGINDNEFGEISFSDVYPNPASNFINIDYSLKSNNENSYVKIINLLGSVVKTEPLNSSQNKVRINTSDLTNGIYFYSIIVNGKVYKTKKLIIN